MISKKNKKFNKFIYLFKIKSVFLIHKFKIIQLTSHTAYLTCKNLNLA